MLLKSRIAISSISIGAAALVCMLALGSTPLFRLTAHVPDLTVKPAAFQTSDGAPLNSLFADLKPTVKVAQWKNIVSRVENISRCRRSAFWRIQRRFASWLGLDAVVHAQGACDYCNTNTESRTYESCSEGEDPVQIYDSDPTAGTDFVGNIACGECMLPAYTYCYNFYGDC